MISVVVKGSFKELDAFISRVGRLDIDAILSEYAVMGVSALASATPENTGLASESWTSEVSSGNGLHTIAWLNTDIENGFPVVIMLQYGHGTGTGGYVQGIDFINPAIRPIFDLIADKVWQAVISA